MLDVIRSWPVQLREGASIGRNVQVSGDILVVAGMGSSGLAGDVLREVLKDQKLPVIVVKDFRLPGFVNSKTLVFVCSYSGSTDEMIELYKEARMRNVRIVVFTSGGVLESFAKEQAIPLVSIPRGLEPRTTLPFFLGSMIAVLHKSQLAKVPFGFADAVRLLKETSWEEQALEISKQLEGIPFVITGPGLASAGLRWQQAFSEGPKIFAHSAVIPEFCHNELQSLASQGLHVLLVRESVESEAVRKRMAFVKKFVKSRSGRLTEIVIRGESLFVRLCAAMYLGDLVAYYAAQNLNVNPLESPVIVQLKKSV